MSWALLNGTVTEVTSNNQLILKSDDGRFLKVTIASVGVTEGVRGRTVLAKLLIERRVEVVFNPPDEEEDSSHVVGEVHVPGKGDVASFLLKSGEAPFEPSPPYTLSTYSECLNRIAEREAREQHRGIWAGTAK
jgi:endonuclease YncB( thermonuclease family)